ncbi:MAG: hypothetical protein QF444_05555, partial [Phycisphaerales bacterium]|nr:hypothetical protein [Phycisphaerales bacterium]
AYALYEEEDTQVQEALLDFFNVQPNIVAIEPALELLSSSASTRNASARTLIKLFSSPEVTIPHETNKRVLKIVKNKRKRDKKNKNLITLEAMLGTLKDKEKLVDFLDRENFRFAVAKGFALSGYAQPLFNMITSESSPYQSDLFPYTLDALQKQGGIDSFVKLMDLRDLKMPADQEKKWKEVVNKLATSLSTRDLLDADEILMQNKLNDLRKTVLIRVWDSPNNQVRKDIANTLIPLLLSYDEAAKAFGLFEDFGDSLLDEELLTLKFSAAIKANFWDAAATIKTEPEAWIIEWIRMKDDKPESAEVLKTEITQRFDALLTLEQRQQLGIETQTIPTEETH